MHKLIVKLNPYEAPFSPPAERGVYWLDKKYQGDSLHDAHIAAVRVVRKLMPSCPLERPAFHSIASLPVSNPYPSEVLSDCGLGHLVGERAVRSSAAPDRDYLADLSRSGIRAARRSLRKSGTSK